MAEYLAPGVFVEEISLPARPIAGVSTSTAAFIGAARFGPVHAAPRLVTSLAEYERCFEPAAPGQALQWPETGEAPNFLWHAVRAFFDEGGRRLFIARVFRASTDDGVARVGSEALPGIAVQARYPGSGGNGLVRVAHSAGRNVLSVPRMGSRRPRLRGASDRDLVWLKRGRRASSAAVLHLLHHLPDADDWLLEPLAKPSPDDPARYPRVSQLKRGHSVRVATLTIGLPDRGIQWPDLAVDPRHASGRTIPDVFGADAVDAPLSITLDASRVADAFDVMRALFGGDPMAPEVLLTLSGGNDGERPGSAELSSESGLARLEPLDEIAIVAAPGISWRYRSASEDADRCAAALIAHAERQRYRIALIDSGDGLTPEEVRRQRASFDSSFAALYYPWVSVADPQLLQLPPSAFVAGVCARVDAERGVWKAPANEVLRGASGLEVALDAARQEPLNAEGINVLRCFADRGVRVWGARSISSDAEWKYVNVRRLLIYIEHSIDRGLQWAAFEPNAEALWAQVQRAVEDFLLRAWRGGALLGTRPEEAFFVRCDRTTMTQDDLDNGRLVCLIGVAPLRPAEFVIVRIGLWTRDHNP